MVTYIKRSDVKEYSHPKTSTKIFRYNESLDTIGYWLGIKMKYTKRKVDKSKSNK